MTKSQPAKHQPATQPAKLQPARIDVILAKEMDERGAITKGFIAKKYNLPPDEVEKGLIRLLAGGVAIWVAGQPRAGVFFTRKENRGRYGLPLMAQHGAINHKGAKRGVSKGVRKLRAEILIYLESMVHTTARDVSEQLSIGYDTARRNLIILEKQGRVKSWTPHDGSRGRPVTLWKYLTSDAQPTVVWHDVPHVVTVRFSDALPPP